MLSGDASALEVILSKINGKEVFVKYLPVNYAFHSPVLAHLVPELVEKVAGCSLKFGNETIPIFSTVTGTKISGMNLNIFCIKKISGADITPDYWGKQIRNPVQLYPGLLELIKMRCSVFVELSPHPVLSHYITTTLRETGITGALLR